jgi:hypothetical protein
VKRNKKKGVGSVFLCGWLLAIYEHAVIEGIIPFFFAFRLDPLNRNGGEGTSASALLFAFVQIQRPHLPHGHALRQSALGEALASALLAHFVAPAGLFPQRVRHFIVQSFVWVCVML